MCTGLEIAAIGAVAVSAGTAAYSAYQNRQSQKEASSQAQGTASSAANIARNAGAYGEQVIRSGVENAAEALTGNYNSAMNILGGYGERAGQALTQGFGRAQDLYASGLAGAFDQANAGQQGFESAVQAAQQDTLAQLGMAREQLETGGRQIAGTLESTMGLQDYAKQAAQAIDTYDVRGGLADVAAAEFSPDRIMANIEASPGYQFRQQQGEEAINRAAAAGGGRVSGRAMKELMQFNQGMASQEAENVIQRRMALAGQRASLGAQGVMGQAASNNAAALQAQSNQMGLAGLGFGAASQLAGLQAGLAGQRAGIGLQGASLAQNMGQFLASGRQAGGQFAAGMRLQGAANQANLATSLAGAQSGLLTGLGSQYANMMTGAGQTLANLYAQGGQARANAMIGAAGGQASALMGSLPYIGAPGGGEMAALSQGLANLGGSLVAADQYNTQQQMQQQWLNYLMSQGKG